MEKVKVGIIGPGNIGSDLMFKIRKSKYLEMHMMAGRRYSEGIQRAEDLGYKVSTEGYEALAAEDEIKIVFDATSAKAHLAGWPILKAAGKVVFDLTPAAVGPFVVPCVNLDKLLEMNTDNFNLVTCGAQATIPIAYAINSVADTEYCEIVAALASKSAGPGTRANIDEFTQTTARGLREVAGVDRAKAIIVLNPAEPPLMMTNTVYSVVKNPDREKIDSAINDIVSKVQRYVPGYSLRVPPIYDGNRVTVIVQVRGAADFLPEYSGNLDIINSAAIASAELLAKRMLEEG